jgi:hypothetical protein
LGIELDDDALADKMTDEPWRCPELYDPADGSVCDW